MLKYVNYMNEGIIHLVSKSCFYKPLRGTRLTHCFLSPIEPFSDNLGYVTLVHLLALCLSEIWYAYVLILN